MNKEEKTYNQILDKKEMSKEEAEEIIDEMYHDKIKVYGEGNVVHVDLIGTVKFTNLEFASVRLLREVVSLENEIRDLYKMMSSKDDEIEYLVDKIEQMKEDYQILKDDIEGHRIAYIDTPEFEENYISKDKIKELIEKYKTEKNNITQIVFSKYGKTQQAYKQVVYTNLIRVLEGLLSGQESDQEGGQEDE